MRHGEIAMESGFNFIGFCHTLSQCTAVIHLLVCSCIIVKQRRNEPVKCFLCISQEFGVYTSSVVPDVGDLYEKVWSGIIDAQTVMSIAPIEPY